MTNTEIDEIVRDAAPTGQEIKEQEEERKKQEKERQRKKSKC